MECGIKVTSANIQFENIILAGNPWLRYAHMEDIDLSVIAGNRCWFGQSSGPCLYVDGARNVIGANGILKSTGSASSGIHLGGNSIKNEVIGNMVRGWSGTGIDDDGTGNDKNYNVDA